MQATAIDKSQSLDIADGLHKAAAWIAEHDCGQNFNVCSFDRETGRPVIHLYSFDDLRRLLPGVEATFTRLITIADYVAFHDGIEFQASRYGCDVCGPESGTVTL